jgi:nicotinamide mononucleotide transporter
MIKLLSVDLTFITILGYPLSYIEFLGTVLYLLSVYLVARRNMLTWPIGIISVLLFMVLFYQIRLYSAAAEQLYYLAASAYGWWYWASRGLKAGDVTDVAFSRVPTIVAWLGVTIIASGALGLIMSRVHVWSPTLFPEAASYPRLDALTTVMSLVAMLLMARKRIESWILWIVVDLLSIWLYFVKGVIFVSLLYVILSVIAATGLIGWTRASRQRDMAAPQLRSV